MSRGKAGEVVKSPCQWMIGVISTIVPFAKNSGVVSSRLDDIGYRLFFSPHTFTTSCNPMNPRALIVPTGEKTGSGRGADRAYVKLRNSGVVLKKTIQNRGVNFFIPMNSQVAITLIISENHKNIRGFLFFLTLLESKTQKK